MAAHKPKLSNSSGDSPRGEREARKGFLVRLPPAVLAELRVWAGQEVRSLNGHIEYLLRDALRRRRGRGS